MIFIRLCTNRAQIQMHIRACRLLQKIGLSTQTLSLGWTLATSHTLWRMLAILDDFVQPDCDIGTGSVSRTQASIAEPGAVATGSFAQLTNVDLVERNAASTNVKRRHPAATAPGSTVSISSAAAASVRDDGKLTHHRDIK